MREELCYRTKMNQAMVLKSDRLSKSWPELGRPIKKKMDRKGMFFDLAEISIIMGISAKK